MPRIGNSAATKQVIITAARRCFAERAYDQVGLRDIAAAAGMDKRLLTRHFGAKANLFAEALRSARADLPDGPPDQDFDAETNLRSVLDADRMRFEQRNDYLSLCLQSANSPEARTVVRDALEADIARHAVGMAGADAGIRSALILSVLFGVALVREIVKAPPLADADVETMVRYTAPILNGLQAQGAKEAQGAKAAPASPAPARRVRS